MSKITFKASSDHLICTLRGFSMSDTCPTV